MIITVEEKDEGTRLDIYLTDVLGFTRNKLQTAIKAGEVEVNKKVQKPSYLLKENDTITCEIKEFREIVIPAQNIPIDIVFENDDIIIVNKPSGMLTHPTTTEREGTLVNALLYRYGQNLSDVNGEFRRGIVHRLDRNTSGLLIVAKNNQAHKYIANLIREHKITKKYRAILKGRYPLDNDIIDLPIGRSPSNPVKMAVIPGGKDSITKLKVLEWFKDATYVELTLVTGRTHQIRVHTSFKGYPVFNDTLYGAGMAKVKTEEQVLQSYYLKFEYNSEIIEVEIEPDLKINKVLNYLRGRE